MVRWLQKHLSIFILDGLKDCGSVMASQDRISRGRSQSLRPEIRQENRGCTNELEFVPVGHNGKRLSLL
jgi:hypothetical protein